MWEILRSALSLLDRVVDDPKDQGDQEYQTYLAERRALVNAEFALSQKLDAALLTLSGGAFGLSIVFLTDIVGNGPAVKTELIARAWWGLLGSITLTVVAMLTGQLAHRRARDVLEQQWFPDGDAPSARDSRNAWSTVTGVLGLLGLLAFLVGGVMLACFAMANLNGGE